ncbi:MAG: hypothetical protein J7M38_14710, partial [Armatimonadetes bacterium]|nr:hypothetical protein [Armatimonadota bacterium]
MSDTRFIRYAAIFVAIIALAGTLAVPASAGVNIEIGQVRAAALQFVQEKFDLSPSAARHVMRQYEIKNGSAIIDNLELPEGAVMDFVRVDGNAAPGEPMVTYEGSGIMRPAHPQLCAQYVKAALAQEDPATRARLLRNIGEAVRRGWFVQTLTPEQRRNLEAYTLPGEKSGRTKAVQVIRILVVLTNFPHWNDRSPSASVRNLNDPDAARNHPFTPPPSSYEIDGNPGGPISTSTYRPAGLLNPSWNNTGIAPSGSGASTSNHPRIEYIVDGHPGTSVDLKEDWYDFLFSKNPVHHPYSLTNYYYANSQGRISIEGNRSDIVGPLESHHQLDKVPLGGTGNDFAVQPGTPIIRDIPDPGGKVLRAITADSSRDIIATLFYGNARSISAAQYYDPGASSPEWTDLTWSSSDVHTNPYDRRRQITKTSNFDSDWQLRVRIPGVNGGAWINVSPDYGWNADWDQGAGNTVFTSAEVLGSSPGNRLLSFCYYTHDHIVTNGAMGSHAYQLAHTRNVAGRVDDIGGTVDSPSDHVDRPKPYDHDTVDHAHPNMGFFEDPASNGGHTSAVWEGTVGQILADEGISPTGYNRHIYLYPSDVAAPGEGGSGTSGPWSGAHVIIPHSSVVLPVKSGLYLAAHEVGHT